MLQQQEEANQDSVSRVPGSGRTVEMRRASCHASCQRWRRRRTKGPTCRRGVSSAPWTSPWDRPHLRRSSALCRWAGRRRPWQQRPRVVSEGGRASQRLVSAPGGRRQSKSGRRGWPGTRRRRGETGCCCCSARRSCSLARAVAAAVHVGERAARAAARRRVVPGALDARGQPTKTKRGRMGRSPHAQR